MELSSFEKYQDHYPSYPILLPVQSLTAAMWSIRCVSAMSQFPGYCQRSSDLSLTAFQALYLQHFEEFMLHNTILQPLVTCCCSLYSSVCERLSGRPIDGAKNIAALLCIDFSIVPWCFSDTTNLSPKQLVPMLHCNRV